METRTLFMIGNGFDLAHNLPTTYMDFFSYLSLLQSSSNNASDTKSVWERYIKRQMAYQVLEQSVSDAITKILHLRDACCENVWHSYFKHIVKDRDEIGSWIDFEKEIENFVKKMEKSQIAEGIISMDFVSMFKSLMHCDNSYSNYPKKLDDLYEKISHKIDLDIATKLRQKGTLFLYEELLRYTFCFELYLRFILPILAPPLEKSQKPLAKLFENNNPNIQTFLLSFNYTSTVQDLYDPHIHTHYIHGRLRSKEYLQKHMLEPACQLSTPLVLGYHAKQTENIAPTPFLFFEKFYQRILHHTHTDVYRWLDQIRDESILETVVYGHSLDVTDEDFIRLIFNKSKNIKVYYHDESVLPTLLTNLVTIFGREYIDRSHAIGQLQFVHSRNLTLNSKKPEVDYALT